MCMDIIFVSLCQYFVVVFFFFSRYYLETTLGHHLKRSQVIMQATKRNLDMAAADSDEQGKKKNSQFDTKIIAELSCNAQSSCSGAPWVRKNGNL